MRVFRVYVGSKIACYCMTEGDELTVNRFIEDISHNPNEHDAAILEDIKNGAPVVIIEEE